MIAQGIFEINRIVLTKRFLEKYQSKEISEKKLAFNNVYFDFIKKGLEKHGDEVQKKDGERGEIYFYRDLRTRCGFLSEKYIPLIYQDMSTGNINGCLELYRKKNTSNEGTLLFTANCNNYRELITFFRELRLCQGRKKRGSIAEAEKGIVKVLFGTELKEI